MEEKKRNLIIFIPTIIFMVAVTIAGILLIIKNTTQNSDEIIPVSLSKNEILFEEKLKSTARRFGIPEKNLRTDIDLEERRRTITIRFPKGKLIEEFVAELFDAAKNTEFRVAEAKHIRKGRTPGRREYVSMIFENKRRANEKIFCEIIITNEATPGTANTAFLIKNLDKLSKENADALLSYPEPLNYILTPFDSVAAIFHKVLSPVLLEIPIEEKETNEPETRFARRKYTIMQSDNRKKINAKIKMLTNFYPSAAGFYSRTGNLVLNSRETSKDFLQELKTRRRNLAFFDARPAKFGKNGVAKEVAAELSVSYDTISISLPSIPRRNLSGEEWELDLKNAIDKAARSRNSVILILADDNFVPIFVKNLPYIQKKGIEFVGITHFSKGE
jgi:polysaccharide deacetylase 2 family uncharacterized protein YibQ